MKMKVVKMKNEIKRGRCKEITICVSVRKKSKYTVLSIYSSIFGTLVTIEISNSLGTGFGI